MMAPLKNNVIAIFFVSLISFTNAQNSSLSALCFSQNEVLAANSALASAAPSRECYIELDKEDTCTVDFESTSGAFNDACFDAGGKIYVVDLLADCTVDLYGITYNADYTFLNFPSCIGINCTADELNTAYAEFVHPLFEQQLAGSGFTCDITDKNEMIQEESGASHWFISSMTGILSVMASVMIASA